MLTNTEFLCMASMKRFKITDSEFIRDRRLDKTFMRLCKLSEPFGGRHYVLVLHNPLLGITFTDGDMKEVPGATWDDVLAEISRNNLVVDQDILDHHILADA